MPHHALVRHRRHHWTHHAARAAGHLARHAYRNRHHIASHVRGLYNRAREFLHRRGGGNQGNNPDRTTRQSLRADQGVQSHQMVSNDKSGALNHYHVTSIPKGHFKKYSCKFSDFIDTVWPKVKIHYLSYGTAVSTFLVPSSSDTPFVVSQSNEAGLGTATPFKLVGGVGAQGFYSFDHFLFQNQLKNETGIQLLALEGKCADFINSLASNGISATRVGFQADQGSTSTAVSNILTTANITVANQLMMYYLGGYTSHTFYNPTATEVHIEFWECRPRRCIASNMHPVSLSVGDKTLNAPYSNNYFPLNSTPGVTDLQFKFETNDDQLHYNYIVTKPRRHVLMPGETLTYTIKHPPFSFNRAAFQTSLLNLGLSAAPTNDVEYLPFCTVFLCLRMKGGMGFNATGGSFISANCLPSVLLHTQVQKHTIRAVVQNAKDFNVYENIQNSNLTVPGFTMEEQTGVQTSETNYQ